MSATMQALEEQRACRTELAGRRLQTCCSDLTGSHVHTFPSLLRKATRPAKHSHVCPAECHTLGMTGAQSYSLLTFCGTADRCPRRASSLARCRRCRHQMRAAWWQEGRERMARWGVHAGRGEPKHHLVASIHPSHEPVPTLCRGNYGLGSAARSLTPVRDEGYVHQHKQRNKALGTATAATSAGQVGVEGIHGVLPLLFQLFLQAGVETGGVRGPAQLTTACLLQYVCYAAPTAAATHPARQHPTLHPILTASIRTCAVASSSERRFAAVRPLPAPSGRVSRSPTSVSTSGRSSVNAPPPPPPAKRGRPIAGRRQRFCC